MKHLFANSAKYFAVFTKSHKSCFVGQNRFGIFLTALFIMIAVYSPLSAKIINVPGDYATINDATWNAEEGDEIIVAPGTYVANCYFGPYKNMIVRSQNPDDPAIVQSTIIQAKYSWSAMTFHGTEGTTSVLAGFTIKNGGKTSHPFGGGIEGNGTRAMIYSCIVMNSKAERGAGLSNCNGIIKNCIIKGNSATYQGGGLYSCHGTIENNQFLDNSASGNVEGEGGAIYASVGLIRNNIIMRNSAALRGAGLNTCTNLIQNNLIANNTASGTNGGVGAGLYYCNGTIENCTIAYNVAKIAGGGLYSCKGFVVNNIIWGNNAPSGAELFDASTPYYSCIKNWILGGKGNINSDPKFTDATNFNYHLKSGSPCINSGNTGYLVGSYFIDIDGECRVNGSSVDMGSDEYGSTKDSDGDLLSDLNELIYFSSVNNPDTDGDGLLDGKEVIRGLNPIISNTPTGISVPYDFGSIQLSIFLAFPNEQIIVYPGVYNENLRLLGKNIVLQSSNPYNYQTVTKTIIDGNGVGPVMLFDGTETNTTLISGFTMRSGFSLNGGAVCGNGTAAIFELNRIIGNMAIYNGGGFYQCHGIIRNNLIWQNTAGWFGGGIDESKATIHNNVITSNTVTTWGGGLFDCDGMMYNNTIAYNKAVGSSAAMGGGIAGCVGEIFNTIFWGNSSPTGAQIASDCLIPSFSCIQDWGTEGLMNISGDPKFVSPQTGDYHLGSFSACVDKGTYNVNYSDACIPPGKGNSRNDIGAYGGPYNCGWYDIGAQEILDYLLGRAPLNIEQKYIADQNGDYYINIADAISLMDNGK